jgi:hypothetical protein
MGTDREQELVAALARQAVAKAAPAELPLFPATSRAYFEDPGRALAPRAGSDDMLGFGPAVAAVLLTPVALDVARRVVAFVLDHVRSTAEKEAGDAVDNATTKLLHRIGVGADAGDAPQAVADAADLSPEQLREVHRIAVEKAQQLHLPADQADLLADSLVGSLAAE